ncbi:LysM domain-containing protein [Leuconostoc carnosum]|uniref:LysM peptidoglycan-binding domain-containing protein n=1 Tax=Leuconostoc carnosum TaxID=1252 RepID=UPI00272E1B48|nr:LysM domain-containing protein [Leuconostoc carnosum]WLC97938.1 LysM domain-containing protein [Leuconostoc carnosum]
MLNFKQSLTIAAGVAGAFAFGATNVSADTTNAVNASTDYVVQSGDTLNKLSSKFNVTVDSIVNNNNITDANLIVVGQHLSFAEKAKTVETNNQPAVAPAAPVQAPVQQQQAAAPVQQAPVAVAKTQTTTTSTGSESSALSSLIARESSGNVNATNGQYYGIGQLSPQARAQYGGNSTDYNDQLNAMKSYISARYGSAENAWAHSQSSGWY